MVMITTRRAVTGVFLAFTGLATSACQMGLPENTGSSQPDFRRTQVNSQGIEVFAGTQQPVPVSYNACRELDRAVRNVSRTPRASTVRIRIGRGSLGEALEDALGQVVEGAVETAGNNLNQGINAALQQDRINQLSADCDQQNARQAWERRFG